MLQDNTRPLYLQVAELIEDGILSGAFPEGEQIPSTTEISVRYGINPATALKGVNELVSRNILYKKRGIGMFVTDHAIEVLRENRKEAFLRHTIKNIVVEANKLNLTKDELVHLIQRCYDEEGKEEEK